MVTLLLAMALPAAAQGDSSWADRISLNGYFQTRYEARDFGTDEETMERLNEALSGTELDPTNLDPRLLAGLPIEDLVDLVAALQDAGLLQGIDLASILPPEILEMIEDAASPDAGTDGLGDETEGQL